MRATRVLAGFLVAVVLLSLGAIYIVGDGEAATVRISVEGAVVEEVALQNLSQPREIALHGKNGIESTVVIEEGRVCIDHANCPDQICVNQGWITDSTLPIVCLPGEIIVEIIGGESSGFDTATG